MTQFSYQLIAWYNQNRRELPWRDTTDPYAIWLSEIILQQTRVVQGLSYFQRFIMKWPDVFRLSEASEQEVLRLWQGLGYYSRARNLLASARQVVNDFDGVFPNDYKQLLQLKGVGKYTAAAIVSIAFNKPHAVIDGNVIRVLSRIFGIHDPVDTTSGMNQIEELADTLLNIKNPGIHNQAMMEFGALQCIPVSPDCRNCVFNDQCHALKFNLVQVLPVKSKKVKISQRYFHYFICTEAKGKICSLVLNKRSDQDIWKGMYDFPMIESTKEIQFEELQKDTSFLNWASNPDYTLTAVSDLFTHQLTHQKIFARFYHLRFNTDIILISKNDLSLVDNSKLDLFPLPRLIDRYLNKLNGINC
ncbi:MAG: A/G-specific adenine glycosylase [Bacteroidetes bacterium HGW-Bacteroidetes-1]|jgi:A/G-specific adenine glycosylase|nr:MAG: A/G-specific adenine glycosylase [Bacteroidetes bacterium HGW-Bacteroidetes-1]